MKFIGWTPTVTGRLSFSAIGNADSQSSAITCNFTSAPQHFLFSVGKRTSKDGPIPPWLLRFSRIEDAYFLAYFDVGEAKLPFPAEEVPELRPDTRGMLEGEVLVLLLGGRKQKTFKKKLAQCEQLAASARNPHLRLQDHDSLREKCRSQIEELFIAFKNTFSNNPRLSPAFAKVKVKLLRSGQTEVEVTPENLFLTQSARQAQHEGGLTDTNPAYPADAAMTARQVFHFVRDLAHRHYHHSPHSDLASTTYEWTPETDHRWRRETHYGLIRMAISSRREDSIKSHKQALGILAYAETFQSSLAGWSVNEQEEPVASSEFFPYQFKPFRDSIDAKMRLLESHGVNLRATLTFLFATLLSAVAAIVGASSFFNFSLNSANKPKVWEFPQQSYFWACFKFVADHPTMSLIFIFTFAAFVGIASNKLDAISISKVRGGFSRFNDGVMGLIRRFADRLTSWIAGVSILAAFALLFVIVGGGFISKAITLLSHLFGQP